jgi:hypothetical protein
VVGGPPVVVPPPELPPPPLVGLPPFVLLGGFGVGSVKLGECHGWKVMKCLGTGHGVGGNFVGS